MALILFVILGLVLLAIFASDGGGKAGYYESVSKMDRWIAKVTNEPLEQELLFAIKDNVEEYALELESAFKEIEEIYVEAIKPVYEKYVSEAALNGEDKRQYWADDMLIDGSSPLFNSYLRTDINKLRILLAKRGFLRKEDADKGARTKLSYGHSVEGVLLKWCADELKLHGVTERFGMIEYCKKGKYEIQKLVEFQLDRGRGDVGWRFFS